MICVLFRVSVSVLRSPSSSPEPSSILVSGTVLRPRFQLCPPSPSPESSSIIVSVTVLRPRSPSESYRDAFAASDADVNET